MQLSSPEQLIAFLNSLLAQGKHAELESARHELDDLFTYKFNLGNRVFG